MARTWKGTFLDVDQSIIENNLRIASDPTEDELGRIFGAPGEQYPSKLVKPFPGFCVKTREVGADTKFFVNICHTDAIPPPKDITEKELGEILDSDEVTDYRVPMSIGEIRTDSDKRGDEARICDIAVNPIFFRKIEQSQLFKNFFIAVVFEGLKEKHGVVCRDEKIILRNKKAFGALQVHRIQQREVEEKMRNRCSGEEIMGNISASSRKPLIETISTDEVKPREPEYQLYRRRVEPNCLIGEFKFPDIISVKELTLDVGEDRIVVESTSRNYLLDIFIPLIIRQASVAAKFNKNTKILTVTMPLLGG